MKDNKIHKDLADYIKHIIGELKKPFLWQEHMPSSNDQRDKKPKVIVA